MAACGFVYHPAYLAHRTGTGHPERPERARVIREQLRASGLLADLAEEEPPEAALGDIELVHAAGHAGALAGACCSGLGRLDADTPVCAASYAAALRAAGGAKLAAERVLAGTWQNAFVCCRPPGHHAERDQAMGFCLINNAAVAASWLVERAGLERVAILDWDVHHGNGTQHAFESDPRVYYASLHQWPLYPGTGLRSERGTGAGRGTTLNCPLAPGSGDREWLTALEGEVLPALEAFRPELVIVSCGFDAHALDPLAQSNVSTAGFRYMTRAALDLAAKCAGGRLVSLLEGGYDLRALAECAQAHLEELRGAASAA
jgi:acetoin utilization deacetylase AcuC-like enzyme